MKKWMLLILGGILIFSLMGCNLLFGAKDVKARNLDPYTTGTLPGDKDEALAAASMGIMTLGMAMGDFFSSDKFENAWDTGVTARFPVFDSMFVPPVKTLDDARSIDIEGFEGDTSMEATVEIKDESVSGYVSGLVTVEDLKANFAASFTENDDSYPATMTANFEVGKCKILVTNNYESDMGYILNSAEMNVLAKGEGGVTLTWPDVVEEDIPSEVALNYDVDVEYKGGFSMSADASTGYCGKYIVELIIEAVEDFSYDVEEAMTDLGAGDTPTTPDFNITILVEVYDNNDDLVISYEYTQDDLANYGMELAEGLM